MRDNIKYIVFVVFEIEYMSTGISKFSHSVLSVLHSVPTFLEKNLFRRVYVYVISYHL